jgi:hypothetical protein
MKASMCSLSCLTEVKDAPRSDWPCRIENQISTWVSQDARVGVKWNWTFGCRSAQSYGIHGTPQPQNVSKTESHGCVRLTNWDALALAKLVKRSRSRLIRRVQSSRTVRNAA